MTLLNRSDNTILRVFPAVQDLYAPGSEHSLAPIADSPLSWVRRCAGWRLSVNDRLTRLFLLHRSAIEAEQAGNWKAADVYFLEVVAQLKAASVDPDLWASLQQRLLSGTAELPAQELRQRALEEIFIDAHCGFYNGYAQSQQSPTPGSRQFFHLDRLLEFVDLAGDGKDWHPLISAGLTDRIAACQASGKWDAAVRYADELLRRYPQDESFVTLKANLLFGRGLAALKKTDSESGYERNAKALKGPIADLESLCAKYPDHGLAYELTAHLKHIRAVNLANAGLPSDALLSNEEALAYWPLAEAENHQETLSEMVRNAIAAWEQLSRELARRSNARLTSEGLKLKLQANAGFGPTNRFNQSEEAKLIRARSNSARLRGVWKRLGLAPPPDRWDERASTLIGALVTVKEKTVDAPENIEACWRALTSDVEDLQGVPAAAVYRFLVGSPEAEGAAPASPDNLPVLRASVAGKGMEPVGLWLFSKQDLLLKAQAALAIAILALASGIGAHRHLQESAREASWAQVEQAAMAGNDLGIVTAAESFFATSPPGSDPRAAEGKELYQAAMVRWFSHNSGNLDPTALQHVQRYRQISAGWWPVNQASGGAR